MAAGGWRGSAPRQTRWLSRCVQSKNTNTKVLQYGLVQCMNASLGRHLNSGRSVASNRAHDQHRQDRTIRAIFQEPQVNSFTTINIYTKMASFSSLDDMRSIELKIEEKAHDLFREKLGQALFSVTRILRCQENGKFFEKDRKLLNLSHIQMLKNVRKLLE